MTDKFRVLLIHNFYRKRFVGGEDIVFQEEFQGLKEAFGDSNVFIYTGSNESINKLKIPFSIGYSKKHYQNVYKMVKKNDIDIVHVHNTFFDLTPSVFKAAHDAGAKVVHTLHNFRWWCPNGILYNQQLKTICEKCVHQRIPLSAVLYKCDYNSYLATLVIVLANGFYNFKQYLQYVDKFIVMTEFAKNKVVSFGIPAGKIAVKPNFVNAPPFKEITQCRTKYLFVGRVDDTKGIVLLVETWRKLPGDLELHIVGTGPFDNYVKEASLYYKNICFHGKVSRKEVFDYMGSASFLIMPSLLYETFGLTIIEAMSIGVPVLATDIGTRKEFVKDGYNGFLFKPTEECLRSAVLKSRSIGTSDYNKMSKNAFNFSRNFSKEKVMKKLISIYKEMLNE